jgi:ketosteroid isomerase-like protein
MTQENVEIVRRVFEVADVQAASAWWQPEIEWVVAEEHPEARTLMGLQAVMAYFGEWEATLDDARLEMSSFVDAGASVVAFGAVRGTGTGSGADVQVPIAFVCTLADGKIARVEEYLDPSKALEAVGLAQ